MGVEKQITSNYNSNIKLNHYFWQVSQADRMIVLLSLYFCAVMVQLLFLLLFDGAILFHKPKPSDYQEPVSVIVAAHNEHQNLIKLIPRLLDQDYPEFEIVIVDDRSTDDTVALKQTYKDEKRLQFVDVKSTTSGIDPKKQALITGITAAQHEHLVFTDADCLPDSYQWLQAMAHGFENKADIVLGVSPYRRSRGLLNLFIRYEAIFTAIQYISFALMKLPYMGVGRNMAYNKLFFLKQGGFSGIEGLTGGDDDLFVNKNSKLSKVNVVITPGSTATSLPKKSWGSFFRQKIRHLSAGKRYRLKDKLILGSFILSMLVLYISGFWLIFTNQEPYLIMTGFIGRWILLSLVVMRFCQHTGIKFSTLSVFFLDILYAVYYISTSVGVLLSKKIKWS